MSYITASSTADASLETVKLLARAERMKARIIELDIHYLSEVRRVRKDIVAIRKRYEQNK